MTLNEYQQKALTTCMESCNNDVYALAGLVAEVGEIQDKIAKWKRKGLIDVESNRLVFNCPTLDDLHDMLNDLAKEYGDVLWFLALLADRMDMKLEQVAQMNLDKLASRQKRGVIDGNGDNR